jgi:hypothetical protein
MIYCNCKACKDARENTMQPSCWPSPSGTRAAVIEASLDRMLKADTEPPPRSELPGFVQDRKAEWLGGYPF